MTDREAFEAWAARCVGPELPLDPGTAGAYVDVLTYRAWGAWQAATEREREAAAKACEAVHCSPIEGAHKEYMIGKEMAVQQCAGAIRARSKA